MKKVWTLRSLHKTSISKVKDKLSLSTKCLIDFCKVDGKTNVCENISWDKSITKDVG